MTLRIVLSLSAIAMAAGGALTLVAVTSEVQHDTAAAETRMQIEQQVKTGNCGSGCGLLGLIDQSRQQIEVMSSQLRDTSTEPARLAPELEKAAR